ncbi:MAG: alanine--tRNA ligase [Candidatus Pacebacteria bacterium]|nr:alanine--tRNA ligase [Candidatus Paceibacterota bacterium]PIR61281.1 MAG: alanine--tRNA ligase [Candidatus Pacebacteria bacterium CG10_big_fil_rev_8_21_14_0_10_45_6]
MHPDEVRQKYLEFFRKQQHAVLPSAPLVPENDPTTLFTGSGMQPMITYLLGAPHPKGSRIVDSQRCFRSQDIEEVGDNRHTTYFEMLGNWSLGDYFKQEQLRWVFTFLTKELKLDPQKLFVTVFSGSKKLNISYDQESVEIWQGLFAEAGCSTGVVKQPEKEGMTKDGRIFFFDEKKNWWSRAGIPDNMPVGEPGGPDSEVFYDFGVTLQLHESSPFAAEPCHVNCDCGRFLEIGNSVFMQYQKQADGSFSELPQMNVDFGGGLERLAAAAINDPDVFTTELFIPIISELETMSGVLYKQDEKSRYAFRVIADHVRAAVMLASDGVYPANKEQGYFVRRLLRRAIRYAHDLGINKPFLSQLVPVVAKIYANAYPQVSEQAEKIQAALVLEEQKFQKVLEKGLRHFSSLKEVDGESAFRLYETYGFPFELTQELAQERGQTLDAAAFDKARQAHAVASRTASAGKFRGGLQDTSEIATRYHTATHLLHAELRNLLGKAVQQKGSNITDKRLRFDFSFDRALTESEISKVLAQINEWVTADLPVTKKIQKKEVALKSGALAFFSEQYPDEVSVYTIGGEQDWISRELCGGPHVTHTSEIGQLQFIKQQAVAAGVRRIYLQVESP